MVGIFLAVWAVDGRPVLFVQWRPGLGSSLFGLLKFRTMSSTRSREKSVSNPDEGDTGPGITRLGGFLRSSSLDELPQLFNIFFGHMSFVGPRPLLAEYLGVYDSQQARRHEVRPGLTGLAQVQGRNALDWKTKLAYDLEYVENLSLCLDLRILLQSVLVTVRRDGIEPKSAASLRPPGN